MQQPAPRPAVLTLSALHHRLGRSGFPPSPRPWALLRASGSRHAGAPPGGAPSPPVQTAPSPPPSVLPHPPLPHPSVAVCDSWVRRVSRQRARAHCQPVLRDAVRRRRFRCRPSPSLAARRRYRRRMRRRERRGPLHFSRVVGHRVPPRLRRAARWPRASSLAESSTTVQSESETAVRSESAGSAGHTRSSGLPESVTRISAGALVPLPASHPAIGRGRGVPRPETQLAEV